MLNEKDFNEIGKRMYDLEADPPKQGWDKIATGINGTPRNGFIRRNWWKPLILVAPLSLYFALNYPGKPPEGLATNARIQDRVEQPSVYDEGDIITEADTPSQPDAGTSDHKAAAPDSEAGAIQEEITSSIVINSSGGSAKNEVNSLATTTRTEKILSHPNQDVVTESSKARTTKETSIKVDVADNNDMAVTYDGSKPAHPSVLPAGEATAIGNGTDTGRVTRNLVSRNVFPSPSRKDSLVAEENKIQADSISNSAGPEQKESAKTVNGTWRLFAGLTPNYLLRSMRPAAGDEILITNIESKKPFERVGFGLSIGGSRLVGKNLFADVQLNFSQQKEQFSYRYTEGVVDTLLATQKPDGSVHLSPVYKESAAEVRSVLSYATAKAGATYFFWERGRRRFNLSAAGGLSYLVHSGVKQKISGTWSPVESDNLAKTMFNLTFSGGYNFMIGRGWEAQLNPSVTYYAGKGNSFQQFLNLNQRSYGLNFSVSKFF